MLSYLLSITFEFETPYFFKVTLLFWLMEQMPSCSQRDNNTRSAHFINYFPVNELINAFQTHSSGLTMSVFSINTMQGQMFVVEKFN